MQAILKLLVCSLRSEFRSHFYTFLAVASSSALIMLQCAKLEAMLSDKGSLPRGLYSFGFGIGLGSNLDFGGSIFLQQAFSSVGILMLSSLFIIFATRFLALRGRRQMLLSLWKLGLSRTGIFFFLLIEALMLAILGCIVGIALGILLYLHVWKAPFFFPTRACAFTSVSIISTAMIACLAPSCIAITRKSGISVSQSHKGISLKETLWKSGTGIALLCLMFLICFVPEYDNASRIKLFSTLGTALFVTSIGFFVSPMIYLAERAFNPIVSFCLGIPPEMTRHCCTGDKWRSIAGILAISSSLAIFLSVHIWAASMLNMFRSPDTIPNAMVRFHPSIACDDARLCIVNSQFTEPGQAMDICVSQPPLESNLANRMKEANALGGNVIAIGVKASQAWASGNFLRLPFIQGSRREAEICFLQGERVCVIPDTLARNARLALNQYLILESPFEDEAIPYRIVGIVKFPWAWFSKCSGLRIREARCSAVVFLPYQYAIYDFNALENEFFWFNSSASHNLIDSYVKDCAELLGLFLYDGSMAFSGGTRWDTGLNTYLVQTSTRENLDESLYSRAHYVIDAMARIPLIALLLSSIAIACTAANSILSRQREFFIMRMLGADTFLIARSILAESILLGLCACTLGTGSALIYASLAAKLVDYAPVFGVISPPLSIPLTKILPGYALTLAMSSLSGLLNLVAAPASRRWQEAEITCIQQTRIARNAI